MGLIYLACPYTDRNPAVREVRFEIANRVAAHLAREGHLVFSPISHSHPMVKYGLPSGYTFWQRFDCVFLDASTELLAITVDAWRYSTGLLDEIEVMLGAGKSVHTIDPDDYKIRAYIP